MKELIEDMGRLEVELHKFETRFGVKSADFYEAMTRGELEEFDGEHGSAMARQEHF